MKAQTALSFSSVVEWMDSMKQLYWLGKYVQESDMDEAIIIEAVALEDKLTALGSISVAQAMQAVDADDQFEDGDYGRRKILRKELPLGAAFQDILEDYEACDEKFYHELGSQWSYWDEVPLPDFLEALLESAAKEMQKGRPSLLGTEAMAAKAGVKEGMCAISYYDLSNAMLVFADEKAAEAFSEEFPVDTSEFLDFYGNGWHCR